MKSSSKEVVDSSQIKKLQFNSPQLMEEENMEVKQQKSVMKEGGNQIAVRIEKIGDSSLAKKAEKKQEMQEEEKKPIGKQLLMGQAEVIPS